MGIDMILTMISGKSVFIHGNKVFMRH